MGQRLSIVLIVVGIAIIVGAILLHDEVVPSLKVFPDDVDVVRDFDVEFVTVLDPETLEFFQAGADEIHDVIIRRHVSVVDTDGDVMLIREEQSLLNNEEAIQPALVFHYPLDRRKLVQVEDIPAQWAGTPGMWPREGFVLAWQIDTQRQDYIGWNEDTRQPVELVYQGTADVDDTAAYYFTSARAPEQIDPAQVEVLGLLPELTIEQVAALAGGLEVENAAIGGIIERALPTLMEQAVRETQGIDASVPTEDLRVPVIFYYDYEGQYWVEPKTGSLLDTIKYEHRAATFPDEILAHLSESVEQMGLDPALITDLLPVTVSEYRYIGSPQAVMDARTEAQDASDRIMLIETTIPLLLVMFGVSLIMGGGLMMLRNGAGETSLRV